MTEFVLFSLPALVYFIVARARGRSVDRTMGVLGLRLGPAAGYGLAALVTLLLAPLVWAALQMVPSEALAASSVTQPAIGGVALAMVVLRAIGEEVLFRGLIAGLLFRAFGFARGNLLQALLFGLPHLWLLTVDLEFWPLTLVQFAAGWLLGWLRHRSGSIGPGIFTHALSNVVTALLLAP